MENSWKAERAEYGDVKNIQALMELAYEEVKDTGWYVIDNEHYVMRHIEKEGIILKVSAEGMLAGFLLIRYPKEAEDNLGHYLNLSRSELDQVAHMESAAVAERFRGMGIQKKLMETGENWMQGTRVRHLMGTAHPDNVYSVNNFLKLGYEIAGEEKKYGGLSRYIFYKGLQLSD